MDTERLIQYAECYVQKKALEEEIKRLELEMAAIDESIREEFTEEGIASTKILVPQYRVEDLEIVKLKPAKRNIGIKRQLWTGATGGDWERACAALKDSGEDALTAMVVERFNIQTISAWVREQIRDGRDLRDDIFSLSWDASNRRGNPLTVTEKFSISVTKA